MTEPGEIDFRLGESSSGGSVSKWIYLKNKASNRWVATLLDEANRNFDAFSLLDGHYEFIVGDVKVTILRHENLPDRITILLLEINFYISTPVALETMWPTVIIGGVVILDDYGHWDGAKSAADHFFSSRRVDPLLVPMAGGGAG